MSRANAAPELAPAPISAEISHYLPSWLVSVVVHLSLLLLLALFSMVGDGGWRAASIVLDCQTAGPEGTEDDELLATAIEVPSELTASEEQVAAAPEAIEMPLPLDAANIALVDPTGRPGNTTGLAQQGAGAPAQTAIFGLAGEGTDFVYVFDRSESMNSTLQFRSEGRNVFTITPLAAAKAELLRSLDDLDERHRFQILFYNHEVWMFDPGRSSHDRRLVRASDAMKLKASTFVSTVYGYGRTRHLPPLEAALKMQPDVIFLLTDGEEKDDPSPAQIARLTRLNGGRTKINVIQFCYTLRTDGALVELANQNGGRHVFMNIQSLAPGPTEMMQQSPQQAQQPAK